MKKPFRFEAFPKLHLNLLHFIFCLIPVFAFSNNTISEKLRNTVKYELTENYKYKDDFITDPMLVSNAEICSDDLSAIVEVNGNLLAGEQLSWWDAPTGGNVVSGMQSNITMTNSRQVVEVDRTIGGVVILPTNGVLTLYVEKIDATNTISNRIPVTITVSDVMEPVLVSDANICSDDLSATVEVNATLGANEQLRWWDSMTGGVAVSGMQPNITMTNSRQVVEVDRTAGGVVTLPTSGTLILYVEKDNGSGCASDRIPVTITVTDVMEPVLVSDASVCSQDMSATVEVSATLGANEQLRWWDSMTGGVAVSGMQPNITMTNSRQVVEVDRTAGGVVTLPTNGILVLYVEKDNGAGCTSERIAVAITVLDVMEPVLVSDASVCSQGMSATVEVSATLGVNEQLRWWDSMTGGVAVSGMQPNITMTNSRQVVEVDRTAGGVVTLPTSGTLTLYVEKDNGSGCASDRIPVTITVTDVMEPVLVSDASICSNDLLATVEVSATLGANEELRWWDSMTGGVAVSGMQPNITMTNSRQVVEVDRTAGGVVTLPTSGTLILYVEKDNGAGCVSDRIPVTITVSDVMEPVLVSDASICGSDLSATVEVSATLGANEQLRWWDSMTGGVAVSGMQPNITMTNSRQVVEVDRTAGGVVILPTNGTLTLYVEKDNGSGCASDRIPVTITVTDVMEPVLVSDASICSDDLSATVEVSSTLGANEQLRWWDSMTGGVAVSGMQPNITMTNSRQVVEVDRTAGGVVTLPTSGTLILYVEKDNGSGCASDRIPVTITVTDVMEPVLVSNAFISTTGQSATVEVNGNLGANEELRWWDSMTGGVAVSGMQPNITMTNSRQVVEVDRTAGGVVTLPTNGTLVLYVEKVNDSGCRSERIPVTITVADVMSPILVSDANICSQDMSATVSVNGNLGAGEQLRWWDAAFGGNIVSGMQPNITMTNSRQIVEVNRANGGVVTLPTNGVLNLYVEKIDANGVLSERVKVTIAVADVAPPTVVSNSAICSDEFSGIVEVNGNLAAGEQLLWWDAPTGGNAVSGMQSNITMTNNRQIVEVDNMPGGVVNLPTNGGTLTLYVEKDNGQNCKSNRVPVTVTVTNLTNPIAVPNTYTICRDEASVSVVIGNLSSGQEFRWWDKSTGGNVVSGTQPNITMTNNRQNVTIDRTAGGVVTLPTSGNLILWVEKLDTNGCVTERVPIVIRVDYVGPPTVVSDVTITSDATSATVEVDGNLQVEEELRWWTAASGGVAVSGMQPNITMTNSRQVVEVDNTPGGVVTLPTSGNLVLYVEKISPKGCSSERTPVTISVATNVTAPSIVSGAAICSDDFSGTVEVNGNLQAGEELRWWSAAAGGVAVSGMQPNITMTNSRQVVEVDRTSGGVVTLPTSGSLTIYVEKVAANGNTSTRLPVNIFVAETAAPILVANATITSGTSSATVEVNGNLQEGEELRWWTAASGGVVVSGMQPNITMTNSRQVVEVSNTSGGVVTLPTAGDLVIYVEKIGATGCVSSRTPVTITVINTVVTTPGLVSGAAICSTDFSGTVEVNGNLQAGEELRWWSAASGGVAVSGMQSNITMTNSRQVVEVDRTAGGVVTLPTSGSLTIYVEKVAANGNTSTRLPVTIFVAETAAPILVSNAVITSGSTSATVEVNGNLQEGEELRWWSSAVGGLTISGMQPNITMTNSRQVVVVDNTPGGSVMLPTSGQLVLYVEKVGINGCVSDRLQLTITVQANVVTAPSLVSGASICSTDFSGTVEVNGNLQDGEELRWWTAASGGVAVSGMQPNITMTNSRQVVEVDRTAGGVVALPTSGNLTIYVEKVDANGNTSTRLPVTIFVSETAAPILVANATITSGSTSATVEVDGNLQTGEELRWWTAASGGVVVSGMQPNITMTNSRQVVEVNNTAEGVVTLPTSGDLVIYVEKIGATGCVSPRTPVTITVINTVVTAPSVVSGASICDTDFSATVEVNGNLQAGEELRWWSAASGGVAVSGMQSNITMTNSRQVVEVDRTAGGVVTLPTSGSLTIYVEKVAANGNTSTRLPVTIFVAETAVPILVSNAVITSGSTSATVEVNGNLQEGEELRWWSSAVGGLTVSGMQPNITMTNSRQVVVVDNTPGGSVMLPTSGQLVLYVEKVGVNGCVSDRLQLTITVQVTNNGVCNAPESLMDFVTIGEFGNSKYYLSNEMMQPIHAQVMAENLGGHLATINTQEENDFVQSNISSFVYLGLNDAATEGELKWESDEEFTFNNINTCFFCDSNSDTDDYVIMASWSGEWSFSSVFTPRHFVVEIPCGTSNDGLLTVTCPDNQDRMIPMGMFEVPLNYTLPIANSGCPDGGLQIVKTSGPSIGDIVPAGEYNIVYTITDACGNIEVCSFDVHVSSGGEDMGCMTTIDGFSFIGEFEGYAYLLSNTNARPADAANTANMNGGQLVEINSQAENDFIFSQIDEEVYIGLNDANSEGVLQWSNGSSVGYNNFDLCSFCNENSEVYDYVMMHGWNGGWSWSSEYSERKFVIELPCQGQLAEVTNRSNQGLNTEFSFDNNEVTILESIMPNPASQDINLTILSSDEKKVELRVFNTIGNLVKVESVLINEGTNSHQMNISDFEGGIYFVRIDNHYEIKKFIKITK